MNKKLRKEAIRMRTEEYWQGLRNGICDLDCYIEELLGRELAYAATHDTGDGKKRLRRLDKPVHTLALTVGESFEPLLQLICVLQPRRVVLILNRHYGGTPGGVHGDAFQRLAQRLQDAPDLPAEYRPKMTTVQFELIELSQDTPTEVFRNLRDALQKLEALPPEGFVNAVDITGAKKSMVVGAFLYAAHSGLPITYVDFDEFSKEFGKPYGYTCKIGQIADPYTLFRLRNWEQVRKLYEHYNFRGARELLEGTAQEPEKSILHAMTSSVDDKEGPAIFEPADTEKVKRIIKLLRVYEAWDNGDFNAAQQWLPDTAQVQLPTAIQQFAGKWFALNGNQFSHVPPNFYNDTSDLRLYLFDELKRIVRLVRHNQDFRSAFLRSGGLNEVLMVARLVRMVTIQSDRKVLLEALQDETPAASALFRTLLGEKNKEVQLDKMRFGRKNGPTISFILAEPMEKWWKSTSLFSSEGDWQEFLNIRNKLAHTYVSVPEELAKDAIAFVKANLVDFLGHKLDAFSFNADAMSWTQLCETYELNFLPPRLRD